MDENGYLVKNEIKIENCTESNLEQFLFEFHSKRYYPWNENKTDSHY